MSKKLAVVAFGGNALLRGNEKGTIEQQEKNTYDSCEKVLQLINNGYNIIITHGNGPQVGNILLRNEAGFNQFKIPKMPLDICVADSQGGIGYMIERQMRNVLNDYKMEKNVITMVTQVLVDINDPAFENPLKPVGTFYLKEEADLLAKTNKWIFQEDSRKRGWRRVVASPKPLDIFNKSVIKQLAEEGNIVIAVGGGGVPVYRHQNNYLEAIEAVVDKDLASAVLGSSIKADAFFILTDVPKAYINFNKANQQALNRISVEEAEKHLAEGQFSAGSMGPKIKAAIEFVVNGGKETVITEASQLQYEDCGTRITL
ncbi:MAG: carbamate kinase [Ignavibacteriae bacterium HGW-Ignavibacteriae-2]|jgi:carbamate kinase|nr:carbamate kinase [Bacteroidota bacterium]PKL89208.1 MAG: carbamate kinase [Ignavibacteriae bacterium HGW-Ignavibacteriae-2]